MKVLAKVLRFARYVISKEELPEDPPSDKKIEARGFFRWLFEAEELPQDRERPGTKGASFWKWILGREDLPSDPEGKTKSGSFVAWIFQKEVIGQETEQRRER